MEFSANERIVPPLQKFFHRKCSLRLDNLADEFGIKQYPTMVKDG